MKLSILNVNSRHYLGGGSDRCYFDLGSLLEKKGMKVGYLSTVHPENQHPTKIHKFVSRVNFENPRLQDILRYIYSPSAAKGCEELVRTFKPDIAHLHIYYGQLTASILSPLKENNIPIIQTMHEYKAVCPVYLLNCQGKICQACQGHSFWKAVVKRCNRGSISRSLLSTVESYVSQMLGSIRKIDHFIAVSDFQRDKVIELGLPKEKVTTIHNFIDSSNIVANTKQGEYFLFFGRLEKIKGVFTLIKAASEVMDVPIFIAGEGSERTEIENQIRQLNLRHVQMLGFKSGIELDKLIRNSICTITPSECYETFGLTLIESFARGRPVIASRIGGMTEIVSDGKDGFLFEPGDARMLAEKMRWIARHPSEAVKMGMAGRRKVEDKFNSEIHYQKIKKVYKNVLNLT